MEIVVLVLVVLLGLGLPTMLARAGRRARPIFIAVPALAGAYVGLVDPLWSHRLTGLIFIITFFQVLATIGAAVARDVNRVRAGLLILAITWAAFLLVSVVSSAGYR